MMPLQLDRDSSPTVAPGDDPATPEARVALARLLLLGAIRRFEEVNEEWTAVNDSWPRLDTPRCPRDAEERAEQELWQSLRHQSQESFNHAEVSLAERIEYLFDMLAPEGSRAGEDTSPYFVPRAVRSGGTTYVLAFSSGDYEPGKTIVAAYRDRMVIDLKGEGAPGSP